MEITIKAEPKEIADLIMQLQSQQNNFLNKSIVTSLEQGKSIANPLSEN